MNVYVCPLQEKEQVRDSPRHDEEHHRTGDDESEGEPEQRSTGETVRGFRLSGGVGHHELTSSSGLTEIGLIKWTARHDSVNPHERWA